LLVFLSALQENQQEDDILAHVLGGILAILKKRKVTPELLFCLLPLAWTLVLSLLLPRGDDTLFLRLNPTCCEDLPAYLSIP